MAGGKREWTTVPKFLKSHKGIVAKNLVYSAIAAGTIPSVRIGRKILITADCLDQLLEDGPISSDRPNKPINPRIG